MSTVTLRSDVLTVSLRPEVGGQVTSIKDIRNFEYLDQGLHPRPNQLDLYTTYPDGGLGGIDDCLPAIAPGAYPFKPYQGWQIPDHGECWQRSCVVSQQTAMQITLTMQGTELPYEFIRTMSVRNNTLRVAYTLTNTGSS